MSSESPSNPNSSSAGQQREGERPGLLFGKVFAIGIGLLCLMVAASVYLMYRAAKNDAQLREANPIVRQP